MTRRYQLALTACRLPNREPALSSVARLDDVFGCGTNVGGSARYALSHKGKTRGFLLAMTGMGDPEKLDAVRVSVGFLRALAVTPVAGRLLRVGEDEPAQDANVAILSHRFWTRRFGRDPAAVGRTMWFRG